MATSYKEATARANGKTQVGKTEGYRELIADKLEELVGEGARRILAEALELEVDEFLQRCRYR